MKLSDVKTPCYVIDEGALIHNLEILKRVERESGARILLAQKCFSGFDEYPLIAKYIANSFFNRVGMAVRTWSISFIPR